ncbi:MAG TPA: bifunctional diaminohydroxyphosphoribosylaminopyrimidine deaminase/5-amino-6-(5-phosphoribosylamino)uracil reductase RibD [Longimicrobiales bacterium]|nr:bifunctional diaminohydroxyphosphoribosylaminopyrimidine deaminase/5-amino-6-(5-phosphoribosylamino)uracil reductase RibD [Longimicrobiales bacterium]
MSPAATPSGSAAALLAPEERVHLERARRLARRGWGHVHPNPMVGCVLVDDRGEVVGEGWHAEFGGPHAEVVALERAGLRARGATAYVSLEPCLHHGKTPPCTRALREAGVRRVVFGALDPDPVAGGGAGELRAAGIEVVGPVWPEREARADDPVFFHTRRHGTPFVALKLAASLDGRIASAPGRRTRVTGPEAEREVHRLRTGFDAVLVGSGTVRADDPRLTPRLVEPGTRPLRRMVLDSEARTPPGAALFEDRDRMPVHVFVRRDAPPQAVERLERAGARVHAVSGREQALDLGEVLEACRELGVHSILCEGGARLAGSLLAERRVHRLYLFLAPRTLGEAGVPAFGPAAERLDWSGFEPAQPPRLFGRDVLLVLDRHEAD